jgi:hypothetical protein
MDPKNTIDALEIEPLSDELLETVAGGKSSDGDNCCSCSCCSNGKREATAPTTTIGAADDCG